MSILVCLEDSASSASAVGVALAAARALHVPLVGLAVIDEPDIMAAAPTGIGGTAYRKDRDAALLEDAHAHADAWLAAFAARGRDAGVPVRTLELTGLPADTIVAEMEHHDLLVFGRDVNFRFETQEDDRYSRDRILRRAKKPIIVAPREITDAGGAAMLLYDGSPAATRALRSYAASGLAHDRETLVATLDDDGANAYEMARKGCDLLQREFGITALPENIVSAEPVVDALLERRAKLGAGLLVIGGYIPSRLSRMVWGSVTHGVLERTVVPVFVHY